MSEGFDASVWRRAGGCRGCARYTRPGSRMVHYERALHVLGADCHLGSEEFDDNVNVNIPNRFVCRSVDQDHLTRGSRVQSGGRLL